LKEKTKARSHGTKTLFQNEVHNANKVVRKGFEDKNKCSWKQGMPPLLRFEWNRSKLKRL